MEEGHAVIHERDVLRARERRAPDAVLQKEWILLVFDVERDDETRDELAGRSKLKGCGTPAAPVRGGGEHTSNAHEFASDVALCASRSR